MGKTIQRFPKHYLKIIWNDEMLTGIALPILLFILPGKWNWGYCLDFISLFRWMFAEQFMETSDLPVLAALIFSKKRIGTTCHKKFLGKRRKCSYFNHSFHSRFCLLSEIERGVGAEFRWNWLLDEKNMGMTPGLRSIGWLIFQSIWDWHSSQKHILRCQWQTDFTVSHLTPHNSHQ